MHMRKTTDYSVVATLIASDYSYLWCKQTSFAWQIARLQGPNDSCMCGGVDCLFSLLKQPSLRTDVSVGLIASAI